MKHFLTTVLGVITGGIVLMLLPIVLIVMISSVVSLFSSDGVKENTVLVFDMSKAVDDRAAEDPFAALSFSGGEQKTLSMSDIKASLKRAAKDENIVGMYMTGGSSNIPYEISKELIPYIEAFKDSGKFIYYYDTSIDQGALYLASMADKVMVMPEGSVAILGCQSQPMFFKGALEKFGVDMQVIRHGKYKSAVEPYLLDKMSDAAREQTQRMLNVIWGDIKGTIAKNRGIEERVIDEYADNMDFVTTATAMEKHLIDTVMYKHEYLSMLKDELGIEPDEDIETVTLDHYKGEAGKTGSEVAVIYANGEIVDGTNQGDVTTIYGDDLSREIRLARQDKDVKAIVLRVNSPGGSVVASELIWREVVEAKSVKPVVVSMGQYAASGGYYISCPADYIFAEPTTLTGSIGIFGVIPCYKGLANSVGVTTDIVKTNKAGIPSTMEPMNDIQREYYQKSIEHGYATFISHCANGRHTTTEKIDSIGQGRVWAGLDAMELGLVDEMGSLDDAIAYAAELAELDGEYGVKELPVKGDSFEMLMRQMGQDAKASVGRMMFGETYSTLERVKQMAEQGVSIQARMEIDYNIK